MAIKNVYNAKIKTLSPYTPKKAKASTGSLSGSVQKLGNTIATKFSPAPSPTIAPKAVAGTGKLNDPSAYKILPDKPVGGNPDDYIWSDNFNKWLKKPNLNVISGDYTALPVQGTAPATTFKPYVPDKVIATSPSTSSLNPGPAPSPIIAPPPPPAPPPQPNVTDFTSPLPASQTVLTQDPGKTIASTISGAEFQPLLDKFLALQGNKIPEYSPLAPKFVGQAPVALNRPKNDYYQNLFNAKFSPLQQDVFGKGGVSDQAVGEAARRGFLTGGQSGVAAQLYEKTVTDPFARSVTDIQNQVNIIRGETENELSKIDAQRLDSYRDFMADIINKDSTNQADRAVAQQNIDNSIIGLENQIRTAIATGASEEVKQTLANRLDALEIATNSAVEMAKIKSSEKMGFANIGSDITMNRERIAGAIKQSAMDIKGNYDLAKLDAYVKLLQTSGAIDESFPFEDFGIPRPLYGAGASAPSSPNAIFSPGVVASPGDKGAPPFAPITGGKAGQMVKGLDGGFWSPNGSTWVKVY